MAELRTPQGHTLLLPGGGVAIGTDPSNEVQVAAHLGLAAVHFRLQPWEGGHFIEDAGSGLGTLVNGHPVNWKPLVHGDIIIAGELEVVYVQDEEAANRLVPTAVPPVTPVLPPLPVRSPGMMNSATAEPAPPASVDLLLPHLPPPAWLPEDLWPEPSPSTHQAVPALPPPPGQSWEEVAWPVEVLTSPQSFSSFSNAAAAAAKATSGSTETTPPRARRKSRRHFFAVAASLIVLGGIGHYAWQQGHLARWIPSLQPLTDPPAAALPSPGHPPLPAEAGASALATPAASAPSVRPGTDTPGDPRVATQTPP